MQISQEEQEVACMGEMLVRYLCSREWKIRPMKLQGTDTSVRFLGVQWWGVYQDIYHSKVGDTLLQLASATT